MTGLMPEMDGYEQTARYTLSPYVFLNGEIITIEGFSQIKDSELEIELAKAADLSAIDAAREELSTRLRTSAALLEIAKKDLVSFRRASTRYGHSTKRYGAQKPYEKKGAQRAHILKSQIREESWKIDSVHK